MSVVATKLKRYFLTRIDVQQWILSTEVLRFNLVIIQICSQNQINYSYRYKCFCIRSKISNRIDRTFHRNRYKRYWKFETDLPKKNTQEATCKFNGSKSCSIAYHIKYRITFALSSLSSWQICSNENKLKTQIKTKDKLSQFILR